MVSIPQGAYLASNAPGYSPDTVTVVIGVNNTVEWTNNENVTIHTVTSVSGNGSLNSGDIKPGGNYQYTFTTPGTYDYFCTYHSWMKGVVVVKAATPVPEFPDAALAVILFAVIAAALIAIPRVRGSFFSRARPMPSSSAPS
jgi:FtsP/CotA-like multicopper oxidase with cupredoxin domain